MTKLETHIGFEEVVKVTDRHKIGIVRAVRGLMSLEEQTAAVVAAGVDPHHVFRIGKDDLDHIIGAFRPGDDILVLPFAGVLGKDWADVLAGVGTKGATVLDLKTGIEDEVTQGPTFLRYKLAASRVQSAPGRAAVAASGHKGGRPAKLAGERKKQAKLAWESESGTNTDVAADFGVVEQTLYRMFGSRESAQAEARKRVGG
jgi:hypothetical protein